MESQIMIAADLGQKQFRAHSTLHGLGQSTVTLYLVEEDYRGAMGTA